MGAEREPWFVTLARYVVYFATLPLWIIGFIAFVLGITLRCIVSLFEIGWREGDTFTDWVFKPEYTNSQAKATE